MPKTMMMKPKARKKSRKKGKKSKSKRGKKGPCWEGYHRVKGTKKFAPGSCAKN